MPSVSSNVPSSSIPTGPTPLLWLREYLPPESNFAEAIWLHQQAHRIEERNGSPAELAKISKAHAATKRRFKRFRTSSARARQFNGLDPQTRPVHPPWKMEDAPRDPAPAGEGEPAGKRTPAEANLRWLHVMKSADNSSAGIPTKRDGISRAPSQKDRTFLPALSASVKFFCLRGQDQERGRNSQEKSTPRHAVSSSSIAWRNSFWSSESRMKSSACIRRRSNRTLTTPSSSFIWANYITG